MYRSNDFGCIVCILVQSSSFIVALNGLSSYWPVTSNRSNTSSELRELVSNTQASPGFTEFPQGPCS